MAFGQLQDEVSGMSDEAPAGPEQPLLQACQRPALDGREQNEPSQKIADVIRDDTQEQAHLIGPEAVAREARLGVADNL